MEHIGIDLGSKESHVSICNEQGRIIGRERVRTTDLQRWLSGRAASFVAMEACTQSPRVAEMSNAAGHKTSVVPGGVVRSLGVGARGIKTDERDADALAEASARLGGLASVHLISRKTRELRELIHARAATVKMTTQQGVRVKSWFRGRLATPLGRANTLLWVKRATKAALEHEEGLPLAVQLALGTLAHLIEQVERFDIEIERLAEANQEAQKLMQIPGVGPIVSLSFVSQIETPHRFKNSDELASYLALVPGEATTGGKISRTGTLKSGPLWLKALLIQSAWSILRTQPNDPMAIWAQSIQDKRGAAIGAVALARKLATVMWSMWKHDTSYDAAKASVSRATPETRLRAQARMDKRNEAMKRKREARVASAPKPEKVKRPRVKKTSLLSAESTPVASKLVSSTRA